MQSGWNTIVLQNLSRGNSNKIRHRASHMRFYASLESFSSKWKKKKKRSFSNILSTLNIFAMSSLKIDYARLRDRRCVSASLDSCGSHRQDFRKRHGWRLSRDCQEIRRIPGASRRERKRSRGSKITAAEEGAEGAERFRRFRVREGADDGCLLLLSGAFAFPRV